MNNKMKRSYDSLIYKSMIDLIIIFADFISPEMHQKQGTFWVIDGLKIKRKQPFKVK